MIAQSVMGAVGYQQNPANENIGQVIKPMQQFGAWRCGGRCDQPAAQFLVVFDVSVQILVLDIISALTNLPNRSGSSGKVRRRRNSPVSVPFSRSGKGPLIEQVPAVQPGRQELVFMPHCSNSSAWLRLSPLECKAVVRFPPLIARVVPLGKVGP
jgi:hypothetical protein